MIRDSVLLLTSVIFLIFFYDSIFSSQYREILHDNLMNAKLLKHRQRSDKLTALDFKKKNHITYCSLSGTGGQRVDAIAPWFPPLFPTKCPLQCPYGR